MEMTLGLGNLIIGIIITLIGFGKINPVHKKSAEKQAAYYKKWGMYYKIGGIAISLVGLIRIYAIL